MTDDYNAAERAHVREASKAAALASDLRRDVVRGIMSVIGGRAWMFDILARCHVFNSTFTGDALTGAFAEGERNIGLQLLNDIMGICPNSYIDMMREADERSITANNRRRRATEGLVGDDIGRGGDEPGPAGYDEAAGADEGDPD